MKESQIYLIIILCSLILCIVSIICFVRENEDMYKQVILLSIALMLAIVCINANKEYRKAINNENQQITETHNP